MSDPISEMKRLKAERETHKQMQKEARKKRDLEKQAIKSVSKPKKLKNWTFQISKLEQEVFEDSFQSMIISLKKRFSGSKATGKLNDWNHLKQFIITYMIPCLPHDKKYSYKR